MIKRAISQDEEIEFLTRLGITSLQARVYLALDKMEKESAKGIAYITEIDRANVYRILSSLQSIGLVEKRLTPGQSFFHALPFKDGIKLLLNRKNEEHLQLQKISEIIIKERKESKKDLRKQNSEYFDLIPAGTANLKAFIDGLKETKTSIDDVINWKGFENAIIRDAECYTDPLKRGVKIRYVTNIQSIDEQTKTNVISKLKKLKKLGHFEVRTIDVNPLCVFAVFDGIKTCICTLPTPDPIETTALWSNNSTLVNLAQSYFDFLWLNSLKLT